jgi:hypothetical protein
MFIVTFKPTTEESLQASSEEFSAPPVDEANRLFNEAVAEIVQFWNELDQRMNGTAELNEQDDHGNR